MAIIDQDNRKHEEEDNGTPRKSLFNRLKRLFSNDVIVRNVGGKKLKVVDTDNIFAGTDKNSLRDRYNRIRSTTSMSNRDMNMSYQAARLELFRDYDVMDNDSIIACLHQDTQVSTLNGFISIKELAEKYPDGEIFNVWSWDKDKQKLTVGAAHHPRKTGTKNVIEIHLDNNNILKCTFDHRIMLIDGTYKQAGMLSVGDSLMPFYYNENRNGYMQVKSFGKKFKYAHRYIYEDVLEQNIGSNNIHHINENKMDNRLENLICLTAAEHIAIHKLDIKNREKNSITTKERWNKYNKEEKNNILSGLKKFQNSHEGKKMMSIHTSELNKKRWKNDEKYIVKMKSIFSKNIKELWADTEWKAWKRKYQSDVMKLKYANDPNAKLKVSCPAEKNGRFFDDITTESILSQGINFDTLSNFCNNFDFKEKNLLSNHNKEQFIRRRLKLAGYKSWKQYKENFVYANHKVIKIVDNNEIVDVYDLTVDIHENFAIKEGIIVSNSALDVYSDECLGENTLIPLLNGEKKTISQLYKENYTNFWVYSLDKNKNFMSVICEKIAYNGKKQMYKIKLDDGTEINTTENHQWVLTSGEIVYTKDLSIGTSLKVLNIDEYTKDYITTKNHGIVSIELGEFEDAYDLVNTGEEHVFAIECKDGSKLFTHNCCTKNELGELLSIKSEDENIQKILHNLFYDILNIEFNLWSYTRNLVKYGDFFLKLEITPELGIYGVTPISAYEMNRLENTDPNNPNYVKFQHQGSFGGGEYENFEIAHFRLMGDANYLPYGKCCSIRSHIDTEFGSKYIKDLNIGEKIWSFNTQTGNKELTTIINKVFSGEKEIIRIRTQHNFIDCTKNHPILIYNKLNKKFEYKLAEDVKIDDLLIINSNNNKKSKEYKINKSLSIDLTCKKDLPDIDNIPTFADEEFCEFFGFMLGDGWIRKYENGYRVCFALGLNEEQNKKYIGLLKKYSGKEPAITLVGSKEHPSKTAIIYSKYLFEILKQNGFEDVNADKKRIPEWIFDLPSNLQHAFSIGFGNADGWTITDKWATRYSIELCNRDLIYDFKKLLQLNNIKTSIPLEDDGEKEVDIRGVKCTKHSSYLFNYYLDGEEKTQMAKYNFLNNDNIFLEPVKAIEDKGIEETCDIQVESSNSNFFANGLCVHNSMIEGGRRVWKQLTLMEDSMLIHRIMRAPEKRVFKVDIGAIAPADVDAYMEKIIAKIKKIPYIDERTGDYNLRFNLQNMVEDFYLPVRGGDSGTSIDTLAGMEFTGIDDIEYLRHKMLAALKIPKAFLGFDEALGGKATLSAQDIRFARTIQRIQMILVSELTKIAIIHLYTQGFTDASLVNFKLELTNPSTIFEQEKIALWSDKISLVKDMLESKVISSDFIYRYVFEFSDNDVAEMKREIIKDFQYFYRLNQIETAGNDPAVSGQHVDEEGNTSDSGIDFGASFSGSGGGGDEGGDTSGGESGLPDEGPDNSSGGGGGAEEPEETPEETPDLKEEHHSIKDKHKEKKQREKDARKKKFNLNGRGGVEDLLGKNKKREILHPREPESILNRTPNQLKREFSLDLMKEKLLLKKNVPKNILLESNDIEKFIKEEKTGKSFMDEDNIIQD